MKQKTWQLNWFYLTLFTQHNIVKQLQLGYRLHEINNGVLTNAKVYINQFDFEMGGKQMDRKLQQDWTNDM